MLPLTPLPLASQRLFSSVPQPALPAHSGRDAAARRGGGRPCAAAPVRPRGCRPRVPRLERCGTPPPMDRRTPVRRPTGWAPVPASTLAFWTAPVGWRAPAAAAGPPAARPTGVPLILPQAV